MKRLPPGRTARLWLRERLKVATRAVRVLEQKSHELIRQQRRLRHHFEETKEQWRNAAREADRSFLRAVAIGGSQQLELARTEVDRPADARVRWRSLMGVTYPAEVDLQMPEGRGIGSAARSSALAFAASAYRNAVRLALDHAAATRAVELVEHELALTRRRLRGLDDLWIPQLRDALREVELQLAEQEREEMIRSKWVREQMNTLQ